MSGDERLTDLLRTASGALGDDLRTDPRALMARARHRRRQRTLGVVGALVALLGAALVPSMLAGDDAGVELAAGDLDGESPPVWAEPPPPGWTRLPDPPLSPRLNAEVVSVGNEVVVVGGSTLLCEGSCSIESDPTLADGAAFSLTTRTWRPIAPAPYSFEADQVIAIGGDVFLFPRCSFGLGEEACEMSLLRYRPADDAWDALPRPPMGANHSMVRLGNDLVVAGDEDREAPSIWRLEIGPGTWTKLPVDPLPQGDGRVLGTDGDDLLLFVMEFGRPPASSRVVAARLDTAKGDWSLLPPAPGGGFEEKVLDGVAIQGSTPVAPGAPVPLPEGGVFDPRSGTWRPLPAEGWRTPPALDTASRWRSGVVGVLRKATAVFDQAAGAVLDIEANAWVELPPTDDRTTTSVGPVGRRLFQFGGARPGQLLNDAWVWTPPAPVVSVPTPAPSTSSATVEVPPTTAPPAPSASTPSAKQMTGAPQFLSATGDASAGRIAVRFDRPVSGDPPSYPPGGGTIPQDKTTPMSLIVFGSDSTCSTPAGNAHEYLDGLGTDTITTDATSLVPGTTFIGIGPRFVKSVADGTFNDPVRLHEGGPSTAFSGMSCIPIPIT